jgi:VWFA-related protein
MRAAPVFLTWVLLGSSSAFAQSTNTAASPAEVTVIKSSTRLVQVNVVVTDKKGLPVQGLKKEDFRLFDGGKPQEIAFITTESRAPHAQGRRLPPNVFSNRSDLADGSHTPTCIILMDALNTEPSDQTYARDQVVKALKTLAPHTHVAIYRLGSKLEVLRDFTDSDATLLKVMSESNAVNPAAFDSLRPRNAHDREQMRDEYAQDRIIPLAASFISIANRVAEVPGRKSIIWITGGVRLSLSSQFKVRLRDLGYVGGGPEYAESGYELFRAASESFNAANVSFYGIDVHGATVNPGIGSSSGGGRTSPRASLRRAQGGLSAEQGTRDTYRMLADRTGGLAFYGSNDLAGALTRSVNDENDSYILGYYPNHGEWNGSFRKITVTTNVVAAKVRNRDGYYATHGEQAEFQRQVQLQQAINSPVDTDSLSLTVSGRPTKPPQPGVLEFQVAVDLGQLMLKLEAGHWKGAIDLIFAQRDTGGRMLASDAKRIDLDFTDAKRTELLQKGAIFERNLAIARGAEDIRVVVRDPGSTSYGTVTVPMTVFFPDVASEVGKSAPVPATSK